MGIIGVDHDVVTVALKGEQPRIVESYRFTVGLFGSDFEVTLSTQDPVWQIWSRYPPNTPVEIAIDGVVQVRGHTHGFESQTSTRGGSVTLMGRSLVAPFLDGFVQEETSFSDKTFPELITAALLDTIGDHTLHFTNDLNRKILSADKASAGTKDAAEPKKRRTVEAKVGQKWADGVVKPELDRAGLFLAHAPSYDDTFPGFVLFAPNTSQASVYQIRRRRGERHNVLDARFGFSTEGRHRETRIHWRSGAGKAARVQGFGSAVDEEMKVLGYDKVFTHVDTRCKSPAQATALALKHQSDARREGFQLLYKTSGHTTQIGDGPRRIWTFDAIVSIDDDEQGLRDDYYIESATFASSPKTVELTLRRPQDMIFADPLADEGEA